MNDGEKQNKLKSRIFSVIGILAGCLIIFAGYWVMQKMLEKRQDTLLSQNGSLSTSSEDQADTGEEEESRSPLTRDELSDILFRNLLAVDIVPHEPYGWQMSMQEAMEIGQTWVESFCTAYDFPEENSTLKFEEMSAQLCTGEMGAGDYVNEAVLDQQEQWEIAREDLGDQLPESMYGYWNISFSGNGVSVRLQINAVSGQVLQANIETEIYDTDKYFNAMENLPEMRILLNYVDSFGFGDDYKTEVTENRYEVIYPNQFTFFAEKSSDLETGDELQWDEYMRGYFVMGIEANQLSEND